MNLHKAVISSPFFLPSVTLPCPFQLLILCTQKYPHSPAFEVIGLRLLMFPRDCLINKPSLSFKFQNLAFVFLDFLGSSAGKEFTCNAGPWFDSCVMKICWRRDRLLTPVFLGFLGGSAGKESTYSAGDLDSIPGLGRSPGEGKGYPLQYSGLGNSLESIVHGVAKS